MSVSEREGEREWEKDGEREKKHKHRQKERACLFMSLSAVSTGWRAMSAMKAVAGDHTVSMCACLHACAHVWQGPFWSWNKTCKFLTSLIKKKKKNNNPNNCMKRVAFRIKWLWKVFSICRINPGLTCTYSVEVRVTVTISLHATFYSMLCL